MRLFLGVDGGGSGTVAIAGDESGAIVGEGRGPACRHPGAIEQAVREAGFPAAQFDTACFGLSGGQASVETLARGAVRAGRYIFKHDAAVALTGSLAGEPGIIVIAGTGSMAYGRNAGGEEARAGGWGYIFGDEGSAFDIVRAALRASLRQEEGWGPSTALRESLLTSAQASSASELLHRFYTPEYSREQIAALAPLVDRAASEGDAIAQEILHSAAQSLAATAGVVRHRLFGPDEAVSISYSGGVFRSAIVLARFRMLIELEDHNRFAAPMHRPVEGALLEAYRAAGLSLTTVRRVL